MTGGPGTGKTTTLNAIISLLKDNGIKVQCAAPTGRAAHRMSELTGCEAKTIHRLLEVEWDKHDKPYFKRDERNMLDCDALVLDELSMVDSKLCLWAADLLWLVIATSFQAWGQEMFLEI